MDLHEYLEEQHKDTNYIPPYGTQLTVRDFTPAVFDSGRSGLRVEAHGPGGKLAAYELETVEHTQNGLIFAICRRDGESVDYIHPWVHRNHGSNSLLATWYDWVLIQDAEHRPTEFSSQHPWDGDSVEAQLYRAEHNVVTYEDFHTNSSNVSSVGWLQDWFDDHCKDSPVSFEVKGITDVTAVTAAHPLKLQCLGFKSGQNTITVRTLGTIESLPPYDEDLAYTDSGLSAQYGFKLMMDGHEADSCHGDWIPLANDIMDHLSNDPQETPEWFAVIPHGLNAAILIPAMYAVITLHFDDDGAFANLSVRSDTAVGRSAKPQQRFRRRWGRWLDKDAPLTTQELAEGLDEVDAALENLKNAEAAKSSQKEEV